MTFIVEECGHNNISQRTTTPSDYLTRMDIVYSIRKDVVKYEDVLKEKKDE